MTETKINNVILSIKKLKKSYPGVTALNDVSFSINSGEIHGLAGSNGAGKSTLIKILSGAVQPDCGSIEFNGENIMPLTPIKSKRIGIQTIHQELNLIPHMKVYENVFLGNEDLKYRYFVNGKKMIERAEKIFEELSVEINPKILLKDLTISYQQMVAIASAIAKKVSLLIIDEATAMITEKEIKQLFNRIRLLKKSGISIIYISHHIEEILEICDRVTILRDGNYICTERIDNVDKNKIISYMIGKNDPLLLPQKKQIQIEPIITLEEVVISKDKNPFSFTINSGEILGCFGLVGSGRTELAQTIFGANRILSGEIKYKNKKIILRSIHDAVKRGIGFVPEDRKNEALLLNMSVAENITISILKELSKLFFILRNKEKSIIKYMVKKLEIKTPSFAQKVAKLSGGNQQKIVISKWLVKKSKVLILDQPTRGIDVASKIDIYKIIIDLAEKGHAIFLISDDLEEVIGISDRIMVMHNGNISGIVRNEGVTREMLLQLAYGGTKREAKV